MSDNAFGPVVLGGNVFGWSVERDAAFRIFDAFADFGGVANRHGGRVSGLGPGPARRRIGANHRRLARAARGAAEHFKIATKVAKWQRQPGLSAANIRAAIEGSLRRLQTDYVDIYYAHEDDQSVSQEEYLRALDALVQEGKVRALGASNFSATRLSSALAFSRQHGLSAFQYSQDRWNLVERQIEQELVPTLQREQLGEFPYYSLASGFLSGKYRPGAQVESPRAGGAAEYLKVPRNLELLAALDEIGERARRAADRRGVGLAARAAHGACADCQRAHDRATASILSVDVVRAERRRSSAPVELQGALSDAWRRARAMEPRVRGLTPGAGFERAANKS